MKNPKCLSEKNTYDGSTSVGLSPLGFLTPCCFTCVNSPEKHRGITKLYSKHLKISNVDNIEEIMFSEEWLEFFDMLENRPEDWPDICIKICDND
jgi:hypothetical protein